MGRIAEAGLRSRGTGTAPMTESSEPRITRDGATPHSKGHIPSRVWVAISWPIIVAIWA